MQIEIKLLLGSVSDYRTLVEKIAPLFLEEESYCDYFFDFSFFALTEQNSVLRLRVPCEKPRSKNASLREGDENRTQNSYHAGDQMAAAFQNFLSSCSTSNRPSVGAFGDQEVELIPNASGKLVFKQNNTVERGHQMNFVKEDKNVPSDVVQALLAGNEAPFVVLCRYAECLTQGGAADNKVTQILEKIRQIATKYCDTQNTQADTSEANEEDVSYSQIRYASGTSLSQPENLSAAVEELCNGLKCVGSYVTTRKVFRYFEYLDGATMTPSEKEIFENMRIRVDKTRFPFGEVYELEIPKCDMPDDEIMEALAKFLKSLNISFQWGSEGKFSRYMNGLRNESAQTEEVMDVKLKLGSIVGYEEVRKNFEEIVSGNRRQRSAGTDRQISNLMFNPNNDDANGQDDFKEEYQENFFFDGPNNELRNNHCFLRLRRFDRGSRYVLVLKKNQTVVEGQQENQSIKMTLSEDLASLLRNNPSEFLTTQCDHNNIAKTLFYELHLRFLQLSAFFTNYRITVPWWASSSQKTTVQQTNANTLGTQRPHYDVGAPSYFVSQQNQAAPFVQPLLIHLDRTLYEVDPANTRERIPFSSAATRMNTVKPTHTDVETGRRTFEDYEIEVTNILPETDPKSVMAELATVLNGLGVEYSKASHSKLDQYFAYAQV